MTHIDSSGGAAALVRAADAELVGFPPQTVRLLADSSSTGGRLSTQRVTLLGGADGAGQQPPQSLLEVQALYDTFFDDSTAWRQARGGNRPDPRALSRRLP